MLSFLFSTLLTRHRLSLMCNFRNPVGFLSLRWLWIFSCNIGKHKLFKRSNVIKEKQFPLLYLGTHISNSRAYKTLNLEHDEKENTVFSAHFLGQSLLCCWGKKNCQWKIHKLKKENKLVMFKYSKSLTGLVLLFGCVWEFASHLAKHQIWSSCNDNEAQLL